MKHLIATAIALIIALAVLPFGAADAASLKAAAEPSTSLPYVTDVNPSSGGYVATVECAGSAKAELKVTQGRKNVKVERHGKRLWTVELKRNKLYKISVRAKGGSWKSIGYRVY